ncbi:MAG TPA: hypothetical protein DCQ98_10920 [Planctomycetaceae bacterium]|nr:hypothetical protein [Planctomycetaceae bacterium]HRF01116.1 M28 family peptidase [Pirellulaceae bacterium]
MTVLRRSIVLSFLARHGVRSLRRGVLAGAVGMLLAAPLPLAAQYAGTTPPPDDVRVGFDTITEDRSMEILSTLVSQGFDGRGTGQEGHVRAAHYVAGKLAEYGFRPIGDNGTYFQNLDFRQVVADVDASSVTIGDVVFRGAAIGFSRAGASQRTEGPVVVLKATGAETRFDRNSDVAGKVVVLVGRDLPRNFELQVLAAEPAAVIKLADGPAINQPTLLRPGQPAIGPQRSVVEISQANASDLASLLGGIEGGLEPLAAPGQTLVGTTLAGVVDVKSIESSAMVPNVVGWFPGSDPTVAHEYVAVGAHLDHLGVQGGELFPGADDNGSGSTAILQIAEALHRNPVKPRRSVLYIAFAAEEMGLLGSKHYVDHPLVPLENCVCMLNIDMIGRNEEQEGETAAENEDSIHLVGTKQLSTSLHKDVLAANEHVGFRFEYDEERVYRRSDHYSFAAKGIPSSFLFGGFNPHYHQVSDGMDGINPSKIANCARLYYLTLFRAAEHGKYELDAEGVEPSGE